MWEENFDQLHSSSFLVQSRVGGRLNPFLDFVQLWLDTMAVQILTAAVPTTTVSLRLKEPSER
jgi:hypothetical protein